MIGTAVKELLLEKQETFKSVKSRGISLIASSLFQDSCVR